MLLETTAKRFYKCLERIEFGTLRLITPEGHMHHFAGAYPGPEADFQINDWRVVPNLAVRGDVAFADDYRHGKWQTSNLTNLLLLAIRNDRTLKDYVFGNRFAQALSRVGYLFCRNTHAGSRRNIQAHYDLGNDFYSLWLDPGMTYSSALYMDGRETLEQAQNNKYDRLIDRIDRKNGNLLEIGCGWGGFAERALLRTGCDIKGITLSKQQHDYALDRVGGRAGIVLEDYRVQDGKYDTIVSIEMFEAVGESYWPVYFNKLRELLKPGGKALIQTITIADDHFDAYRRSGDAIRSYIFPGGMLPSPLKLREQTGKAGLKITDSFSFGQDYAFTLETWLDRFNQREEDVRGLGYDDAFMRMWRYYLSACIAGFTSGRTDVVQMELCHA